MGWFAVPCSLPLVTDLDLDGPDIDQGNFSLPTLAAKLRAGSSEVHGGKGFFVVRGLDPKKYSPEDNVMMFLGVSSYVGEERAKQDNLGNMLGTRRFPGLFWPRLIAWNLVHLHHDRRRYPVSGEGPARHSNKASVRASA